MLRQRSSRLAALLAGVAVRSRHFPQAVQQLRHTLAPSDEEELHEDDTGWAAAAVREQLNTAPGDKVQELTLQQLSVALSAYVASSMQPPARVLQQVSQRLEQVLHKEFNADDITTALNSLAFFGHQASETLIEAIRASLARTYFAEITPVQLGTLMLAIAELGHRNHKLLSAVAREVVDRVDDFGPVELSEIMWSFAVLGHRHERMVDVVTQSLLFRLSDMPVASMSQLVCAFAVLKHKDAVTDVFLDAVSDEALKKVEAFEAGDMANMMWAYASLGHWSYVDADLISAVTARMLRVHKELNASSMVNVVWALAKTDYAGNANRRTRTLLDNIAKSAMSQMECFTPEQLSRLLWAFSTLHHWHEELYDAVAAETLLQVNSFLPCHLADMVSAYAHMVHHPGPLLDQMTHRILPKLDTMDAGALCSVLWAHGVLQTLTPDLFDKVCQTLETKSLGEFKPHDFERAFHAELLLEADLESKKREDFRKLPKWIRQYAYRAWQDRIYFDRNVTWFQQEVCRSLIELGVNFELEKFLADGCHTVDIVLRIPGKPRLGINMDPPQRFSSNRPYRPLAEAVCQRRLLAAQGWEMITLPQHEWRRNDSPASQVRCSSRSSGAPEIFGAMFHPL
ncbi:hypothetical protein WJX79_002716 [Trebouxia sp. C0005]